MDGPVQTEYISAGGNRHSAASDWSRSHGVLAYGADQNIALWKPLDKDGRGVLSLLRGHEAKVTAVKFSKNDNESLESLLLSGSADGKLSLWPAHREMQWARKATVKAHEGALNCIAELQTTALVATGGADALIKLWRWDGESLTEVGRIPTKPRFIPLSMTLGMFAGQSTAAAAFLIAAGTRNDIQVYGIDRVDNDLEITHSATLTGHEGWIRCLALRRLPQGDYILASTSADKYVRLWRLSSDPSGRGTSRESGLADYEGGLTAKVQNVSIGDDSLSITFEALLLGHEDWVYSAAWSPSANDQLLTSSADGSLTIWEPDPSSGIWVSITRLGEISGQKGATTATGSAGGFWSAHWSPNGDAVTCLGRTGSWRLWQFDDTQQYWVQKHAVSGHASPVSGISWAPDGSYLLSTGSDQTTRLHAEWQRGTKRSWHEFARPQIHGYDLNCVSANNNHQFVSGADEKLLRVFDEPKSTAKLLARLCNVEEFGLDQLPETAAIPVLGLSNKAMDEMNGINGEDNSDGVEQGTNVNTESEVDQLVEPPSEDLLARHTLWPEHEKLYGHGYEISESASNGHVLATACKASSLDHAVIRLYDTITWNEIRPPLSAHTLTVTRLAWSPKPQNLLLSVGRDRQWTVFQQQSDSGAWRLLQSNQKAHTRMILDAAWSPDDSRLFFATAGRDKSVKLWARSPTGEPFALSQTISCKTAVTAVAVATTSRTGFACVAAGEDDGTISLHVIDLAQGLSVVQSTTIAEHLCPSRTVCRLVWRPNRPCGPDEGLSHLLAVASGDSSVRLLRIGVDELLPK